MHRGDAAVASEVPPRLATTIRRMAAVQFDLIIIIIAT